MKATSSKSSSSLSRFSVSNPGFRTLIKSRTTHEPVCKINPSRSPEGLQKVKGTIEIQESFQKDKSELKNYIRSMNIKNKLSRNGKDSRYQTFSSISTSVLVNKKQQYHKQMNKTLQSQSSRKNMKLLEDEKFRSSKKGRKRGILSKSIPIQSNIKNLQKSQEFNTQRNKLQNEGQREQQASQNDCVNDQNGTTEIESTNDELKFLDTIQRKVQQLLNRKWENLGNYSQRSQHSQNKNNPKLIEKQLQDMQYKIKSIKSKIEPINQDCQSKSDLVDRSDDEINTEIMFLNKKVKILERLMADKMVDSDTIKSQYLDRLKRHRKNISSSLSQKREYRYREANRLNTCTFDSNRQNKATSRKNRNVTSSLTSNQISYKTPKKEFYAEPVHKNQRDSHLAKQPIQRSSYKREFLLYGNVPRQTIEVAGKKSHDIFNKSTPAVKREYKKLNISIAHEDFQKKVIENPEDYKQLDGYKDKYKSLNLNYGKDRNHEKIGQSSEYFKEEDDVQSCVSEFKKNSLVKLTPIRELKEKAKDFSDFGVNEQIEQQFPRSSSQIIMCNSAFSRTSNRQQSDKKRTLIKPRFKSQTFQDENIMKGKQIHPRDLCSQNPQDQSISNFKGRIRTQIKHKNLYSLKYHYRQRLRMAGKKNF